MTVPDWVLVLAVALLALVPVWSMAWGVRAGYRMGQREPLETPRESEPAELEMLEMIEARDRMVDAEPGSGDDEMGLG